MLHASIILDINALPEAIKAALLLDPKSTAGLELVKDPSKVQWDIRPDGLLHLDKCIYVPNYSDLCLQVLCYFHDHPLSGHFSQNHTLDVIQQSYTWPKICKFIHDYVGSCTTCGHNKLRHH